MSNLNELLDKALINIILKTQFIGEIITKLGVKIERDESRPFLAWTDGRSVTVNEYAFEKMNEQKTDTDEDGRTYNTEIGKEELIFVLAHEAMHLLNLTHDRAKHVNVFYDDLSEKGRAKHTLWNMATDYEINSLLYHNTNSKGESKAIGKMPEWVCYKEEYRNMTAEQIYAELLKDQENKSKGQSSKFVTSGNMGQDSNNQNQNSNGQSNNNSSQGSTDNNNGQKPAKGLKFGLDMHTEQLDDMTKAALAAKIADAFSSCKGKGTGLSAFDRALEIVFKPQPFNWRRALTRYIKSFMKDNFTWNKPSRAGIANGIILPSSHQTPKLHVAIAVDTSGSIDNSQLELLLNHVYTILKQFKAFRIDLWSCSTMVHEDTFMTLTNQNKNDINKFKIQSTGGTDMSANLDFIETKYKNKTPDLLMIFTDGYDNLSGDTTRITKYPVCWLIVDNKKFVKPSKMPGVVYNFEN